MDAPNTDTADAADAVRAPIAQLALTAGLAAGLGVAVGTLTGAITPVGMIEGVIAGSLGAGVAAVGLIVGLLLFVGLKARSVFTWSSVVLGESAGRLMVTAAIAAGVYVSLQPAKAPFWIAFLVASLAALACWTVLFQSVLNAATAKQTTTSQSATTHESKSPTSKTEDPA